MKVSADADVADYLYGEYCVLKHLLHKPRFLRVYGDGLFDVNGYHKGLLNELKGCSLKEYFCHTETALGVTVMAEVAISLLCHSETLHNSGFVHTDISVDNNLLDRGFVYDRTTPRLFIIVLGMSQCFGSTSQTRKKDLIHLKDMLIEIVNACPETTSLEDMLKVIQTVLELALP